MVYLLKRVDFSMAMLNNQMVNHLSQTCPATRCALKKNRSNPLCSHCSKAHFACEDPIAYNYSDHKNLFLVRGSKMQWFNDVRAVFIPVFAAFTIGQLPRE